MFQFLVNFGQWPCLFRVKGWSQLFKPVKTNIDIWHNLHIVTDNSISITGESESWSDSSAVKGKINTWPSLQKQVIWFSVRESEGEKWCSDSLSERNWRFLHFLRFLLSSVHHTVGTQLRLQILNFKFDFCKWDWIRNKSEFFLEFDQKSLSLCGAAVGGLLLKRKQRERKGVNHEKIFWEEN